jgi:hypothetical protein
MVACISRYSNPAGTQGNNREFFTRRRRPPPPRRALGASTLVQTCTVSFTGEISPNFDLKKSVFDLYKGFFMEQKGEKKPPKFARFSRSFKKSNRQIFMTSFSR